VGLTSSYERLSFKNGWFKLVIFSTDVISYSLPCQPDSGGTNGNTNLPAEVKDCNAFWHKIIRLNTRNPQNKSAYGG
jgi:hypothetical protein